MLQKQDYVDLLDRLRTVDKDCGGLSTKAIQTIADDFGVSAQRVDGMATFYSQLDRTESPDESRGTVRVCDGLTCWVNGANEQRDHLAARFSGDESIRIDRTSCIGQCDRAPVGLSAAGVVPLSAVRDPLSAEPTDAPRYADPRESETRIVLPSYDGPAKSGTREFPSLSAALGVSPDDVIATLEQTGLRGRGGAEFPTGRKWRIAAETEANRRFIVGNADESEPLTFKDRVLIDTDPYAILEGMSIAGYAVGAEEGIIYVRGEYESQAQRLESAIADAESRGWLGGDIRGSGFSFHIHVHRGAGAYICGEETALLESLEGKRGEPRVRPPYPVTNGLHGFPTVVNNVETLARVTAILRPHLPAYVDTRLHGLQGHVAKPGLVEVTPGFTLRELIDHFAGGMRNGSEFQFALTGGAAGTFVGQKRLDVPLDENSGKRGVALGSGGILVCDHSITPPLVLREVLHFFEQESCGKCTPCRIGTSEACGILDRLLAGDGQREDFDRLHQLAKILKQTSLCGLGKSAAEPIETALSRFRDSFDALLP